MNPQPNAPVLVGVGDVRNRSSSPEHAVEPAQLMANAIQAAVQDCGLDSRAQKALLSQVDSLRVVPTWTWAYGDLAGVICDKLGVKPSQVVLGQHGGHQPALQCDEAARDVAAGRSKVSVLTGGEALASRTLRLPGRSAAFGVFVLARNQLTQRPFTPLVASCRKAGQDQPSGWPEPDPDGQQLASLDLSILQPGE
ncbi:hypothetical protein UVI_02010630 [Ustilaginoidea virens]|uniref:Acetyl-CoA acetyltransferase n=1 Tax=Ustilaginoidea virens TaxID=1159556 RepID=A0A1B5KZA8_USTVR|nr:hypothetical protein UVI_02010630 [Ustilaginoidea virens]